MKAFTAGILVYKIIIFRAEGRGLEVKLLSDVSSATAADIFSKSQSPEDVFRSRRRNVGKQFYLKTTATPPGI